MRTHESEEMYLETILLLKQRMNSVRSIDVAEELGYAKSSVSRAVNLLVKKGYIGIEGNGVIELTETGRRKANGIYERH
ncbi:MAG: metal-dependent transcriptional regulator, partial [Candidatus Gallimonas sp.]